MSRFRSQLRSRRNKSRPQDLGRVHLFEVLFEQGALHEKSRSSHKYLIWGRVVNIFNFPFVMVFRTCITFLVFYHYFIFTLGSNVRWPVLPFTRPILDTISRPRIFWLNKEYQTLGKSWRTEATSWWGSIFLQLINKGDNL